VVGPFVERFVERFVEPFVERFVERFVEGSGVFARALAATRVATLVLSAAALALPNVQKHLEGRKLVKLIYKPGRIIGVVTGPA